eukprot:60336-Chlamydomonas_euryale.AAC.1
MYACANAPCAMHDALWTGRSTHLLEVGLGFVVPLQRVARSGTPQQRLDLQQPQQPQQPQQQ